MKINKLLILFNSFVLLTSCTKSLTIDEAIKKIDNILKIQETKVVDDFSVKIYETTQNRETKTIYAYQDEFLYLSTITESEDLYSFYEAWVFKEENSEYFRIYKNTHSTFDESQKTYYRAEKNSIFYNTTINIYLNKETMVDVFVFDKNFFK